MFRVTLFGVNQPFSDVTDTALQPFCPACGRPIQSPADFANRKGTHPTTVSVHYLSYDKEGQAEMNGRTFFSRTTDITYSNTVRMRSRGFF